MTDEPKQPEGPQHPEDVLSRQQRRAIERAMRIRQKPLALQPMPWRMADVERRLGHNEAILNHVANLLVQAGVLKADRTPDGTITLSVAPKPRPWWQRLIRRA